jgi:hypothetical protein
MVYVGIKVDYISHRYMQIRLPRIAVAGVR